MIIKIYGMRFYLAIIERFSLTQGRSHKNLNDLRAHII